MHTMFTWAKNHYVILLLFLATALRLAYVFTLEDRWYYFDTAHYDSAACSILENGTFGNSLHYYDDYEHYCLEPVYPLFLAGIYKVCGRSFLAVRIVQSLLSVLHLYVIFLLVRLLRPKAAKWALLFGVVYPFFIYISGLLYVTQLFALFLTVTVYFFFRYRVNHAPALLFFAALSLGAAIAARPVALPMSFLFMVWILFFSNIVFLKKLAHALLYAACILIVLLPWSIRNWNVYQMLSPGRTCLAETRVFETVDLEFRIEDSKTLTSFPVTHFSVRVDTSDAVPVFKCFADSSLIATLKVIETFEQPDSSFYGLIFKGGTPMSIESVQYGHADRILLDSQKSPVSQTAGEITVHEHVALAQSGSGWQYLAVFDSSFKADTFSLTYPNDIKPADVSRAAILFNLDKPSLDANGYMIWLHPWMQADLWRIENGRPAHSVKIIDLYIKEHPVDVKALVLANPVRFLTRHVIPEFINFWSPSIKRVTTSSNVSRSMNALSLLFFTPLLVFFLIGTCVLLKHWRVILILFIPIFTVSGVYSIFFTELRYRIPIDGFLIVLAAVGIDWVLRFLSAKVIKRC